MNSTKVIIILILLVLFGSPALSTPPILLGPLEANAEATKEPEKIVREYFAAYLAWSNKKSPKRTTIIKPEDAISNKSLDPNYVTKDFIEAYQKLKAEDARMGKGEVGILDHDPFICAQDFPDDMSSATVALDKMTDNDAAVKVNLWGPGNVKPFMVKLKKQKEGWRINAIICPGAKYNIE